MEHQDNEWNVNTKRLSMDDLPAGELLVRVHYSSVNYKDAMALTPGNQIVRSFPFVPGIDLAGTVVSSEDSRFHAGEEIVATGYGLGVSHYGGYSEYARIPADWAVKRPLGLSSKEAMALGTAGFTAALSVMELQNGGIDPERGRILVTGATGGVGSIAVAILSKLGYEVEASTGKPELADYLLGLGAARVISREDVNPGQPKPLDKQLWAGVVDCVGGTTLSAALSRTKYGGIVTASGLTGGTELHVTVFPFILRGIRLIGIDSVQVDMAKRCRVWELLAGAYKPDALERTIRLLELEDVTGIVPEMLQGKSKGRPVVRLSGE
jgi:acrylyl-CoA reductase (NADPH)